MGASQSVEAEAPLAALDEPEIEESEPEIEDPEDDLEEQSMDWFWPFV